MEEKDNLGEMGKLSCSFCCFNKTIALRIIYSPLDNVRLVITKLMLNSQNIKIIKAHLLNSKQVENVITNTSLVLKLESQTRKEDNAYRNDINR